MFGLIKLEGSRPEVWVNPDHIVALEDRGPTRGTIVHLCRDIPTAFNTDETIAEFTSRLRAFTTPSTWAADSV